MSFVNENSLFILMQGKILITKNGALFRVLRKFFLLGVLCQPLYMDPTIL